MEILKILVAILLLLEQKTSAGKRVKLIYEKDTSEHCRRRVAPSIFLGRQVIDANAHIMQFSRLDLPYSCYISVRTESGSSIVMTIYVTSSESRESCKHGNQLLVYEMGETFGGYWGPLPETLIKQVPLPPKVYTLKTTEETSAPVPTTIKEEEEETETTETSTRSSKRSGKNRVGDYVEVEVPLLNLSVRYVPPISAKDADMALSNVFDSFDVHHDVTPIRGVAYDSSIIPLVQFHLVEPQGGRQLGDVEPPKYEPDILQDYTPDLRLTMPPTVFKRKYKERYRPGRRLNFKKHRTLFHSQRHLDRRVMSETITRKKADTTKYSFPTRNITKDKPKQTQDSWRVIEDLIKKLNKTKTRTLKTTLSMKNAKLLERISNMEHNKSAYLSNLTILNSNKDLIKIIHTNNAITSTLNPVNAVSNSTQHGTKTPAPKERINVKTTTSEEYTITDQSGYHIEKLKTNESTTESLHSKDATSFELKAKTDQQVLTLAVTKLVSDGTTPTKASFESQSNIPVEITNTSLTIKKFIDTNNNYNNVVTGSLVGHESWENLVQAAPEMAVFLNQTVADVVRGNTSDDAKAVNEAPHKSKMVKRKRDIHSIPIENAHPHYISTEKARDTTTQLSFEVADMQEFAQLVELQDDELHGRWSLRHLNEFIGPPMFNLCDLHDPTKPQVHLFNSSRILLSPTNFTIDRMVIILTVARALLTGELRCPKGKIECQVSGARVCLDSMVACDGVPNCGSYDIYDEDRLMCGGTASLQHNVYLAAFTLLAVLLTIIYAVHYWLKRCVPQVADAFFVYSDGVENVLYLDSIMRSPHELIDDPRIVYHSHMYGDDMDGEYITQPKENLCRRFLRKICCCCKKTLHKTVDMQFSHSNFRSSLFKRVYSFTELEIRKMTAASKDTAVQTGDSLELKSLEYGKDKKTVIKFSQPTYKQGIKAAATSHDFLINTADSLLTLEEPLPEQQTDELSLLKFLKTVARNKRDSSIDLRTDMFESGSKKSPPKKKTQGSYTNESPSETELENYNYDRRNPLLPGPSKARRDDKEQIPSIGSVSKHLRFDEVTTTIPAGRYANEDYDGSTNVEGRRIVLLGDRNRRSSRVLDTIEETDEQGIGTREHRHFWGSSKAKKPKKKSHVSHRL